MYGAVSRTLTPAVYGAACFSSLACRAIPDSQEIDERASINPERLFTHNYAVDLAEVIPGVNCPERHVEAG